MQTHPFQGRIASLRLLPLVLLPFLTETVRSQETTSLLPNIVIMIADDMGIGDTSVYQGKRPARNAAPITRTVRTPNLDRFAQAGVVFTSAYAPASMCSSTRYSLLTGRYAHRAYLKKQGWLPHGPNTPMIQRALMTLPEMLQQNGYHTAAIGKYHVGMSFSDGHGGVANEFDYGDVDFTQPVIDGPTHHGFDEFFGVPGNTEDPLDTEPRIYLRNDRWTVTDRANMKRLGMRRLTGRILAAPDWDLARLGADYLREALAYLDRRKQSDQPFLLYFAPNANHYQRNPKGDYAVPEQVAGHPVRGHSRYTDGTSGGSREDMILENDLVFGEIIEKLRTTEDPRRPGHKLIENTLVIFTSDNGPNVGDNLGRNPESGGLRGKKAKIWEGGIRVPFIASLPAKLSGGRLNDTLFSLTDLYATLAGLIGHTLHPDEAQDSHDSLAWWLGTASHPDDRPRVFFCHLGPPFSNDTLAIRKGHNKLIVDGGLAMPWIRGGKRGHAIPRVFYNLDKNPYEEGESVGETDIESANALAEQLLQIHNRGYGRQLKIPSHSTPLVQSAGWHNPRNDLTGEIGFEFIPSSNLETSTVTHLGLWNAHGRDRPVRPARDIPTEFGTDQPGREEGGRQLKAAHTVRLVTLPPNGSPAVVGSVTFSRESAGKTDGPFRYLRLDSPVRLTPKTHYYLLLSTVAGDGDPFRDLAAHDGLSPLIHPEIEIVRSLLIRTGDLKAPQPIPAFADLHPDYQRFRLPVGPTLRLATGSDATKR